MSPSPQKPVSNVWRYILRQSRWQLLVVPVFIAALFAVWYGQTCLYSTPIPDLGEGYAKLVDPLLTVFTLVTAIVVWYNGQHTAYMASLPRQLDVYFRYEGQVAMACLGASLAHEGDVRNWAQQIGSQMSGVQRLVFGPDFRMLEMQVRSTAGQPHVVRRIAFDLEQLPEAAQLPLAAGGCLVWLPTPNGQRETLHAQQRPDKAESWTATQWRNFCAAHPVTASASETPIPPTQA